MEEYTMETKKNDEFVEIDIPKECFNGSGNKDLIVQKAVEELLNMDRIKIDPDVPYEILDVNDGDSMSNTFQSFFDLQLKNWGNKIVIIQEKNHFIV